MGPNRRFYNRITGKSFVAAVDSANDAIIGKLDENSKTISAQNRISLEEFNKMLKDEILATDGNTAGFTFFGGKIPRKRQTTLKSIKLNLQSLIKSHIC